VVLLDSRMPHLDSELVDLFLKDRHPKPHRASVILLVDRKTQFRKTGERGVFTSLQRPCSLQTLSQIIEAAGRRGSGGGATVAPSLRRQISQRGAAPGWDLGFLKKPEGEHVSSPQACPPSPKRSREQAGSKRAVATCGVSCGSLENGLSEKRRSKQPGVSGMKGPSAPHPVPGGHGRERPPCRSWHRFIARLWLFQQQVFWGFRAAATAGALPVLISVALTEAQPGILPLPESAALPGSQASMEPSPLAVVTAAPTRPSEEGPSDATAAREELDPSPGRSPAPSPAPDLLKRGIVDWLVGKCQRRGGRRLLPSPPRASSFGRLFWNP
jgi:hypothetical protein